jgi:hypothetical protein
MITVFRSEEEVRQKADSLMNEVEANPGITGNLGRLMAAKVNLEWASGKTLPIPERWNALWKAEVARQNDSNT